MSLEPEEASHRIAAREIAAAEKRFEEKLRSLEIEWRADKLDEPEFRARTARLTRELVNDVLKIAEEYGNG